MEEKKQVNRKIATKYAKMLRLTLEREKMTTKQLADELEINESSVKDCLEYRANIRVELLDWIVEKNYTKNK